MKKKLSDSLKRLKKKNPDIKGFKDNIKKLTPYEITVFRTLKDKYELSVLNNNEKIENESDELSEDAKETLERINKGISFEFPK